MTANGRQSADDFLATLLARGERISTAAKQVNVSERTVYRRLNDPAFSEKVADIRAMMIDEAIGRLAGAATKAASRLIKLTEEPRSEAVQLGAARELLAQVFRIRTSIDLDRETSRGVQLQPSIEERRAAILEVINAELARRAIEGDDEARRAIEDRDMSPTSALPKMELGVND